MRTKTVAVVMLLALFAAACGTDEPVPAQPEPAPTIESESTPETETEGTVTEDTMSETAEMSEDAMDSDLLATVTARGELKCGVNETLPGFGYKTPDGEFAGFDVDLCRAVAAALFGDADAVAYEALTSAARFEALTVGLVDLLSRNTTWTQSRDADLGLEFGPTTYYDGQQLMAKGADGFTAMSTLNEIDGATVCTNAGSTTEKNIAETAEAMGIAITLSTFEDFNVVLEHFKSGACDVVTTDGSGLVARKVSEGEAGQDWVIFPDAPISKEPLGPVWVQNQDRFGDVVNWTVFAMIIAEEKGITSANIDEMIDMDGETSRLFGGSDDELQTKMGLPADAFYQVIKQVGNYGEVYDRHLSPLGLGRGLNALYTNGGVLYPPPAR